MRRNLVFKSERSPLTTLIILGATILIIVCCINIIQHGGTGQWFVIVLALVAAMMLWMWFRTYYEIDEKNIWYRSGPVNGSVQISAIKTISKNQRLYSGLKPALGMNGCVIYYNKYDEIYFSPKDKDGFVAALLHINPAIEIIT